jgi:hypothetical protein
MRRVGNAYGTQGRDTSGLGEVGRITLGASKDTAREWRAEKK